jgi:galactokinase
MPSLTELSALLYPRQAETSPERPYAMRRLYGTVPQALETQKSRYQELLERFAAAFPDCPELDFYSAPGRTEVGGNHTDHNNGRVLAAAVDLDIVAAAAPNSRSVICVHSEGYTPIEVHLDDLSVKESETATSAALVRGICARLVKLDHCIGGFDAVLSSRVPKGSGLSSSAAYEVLIATILNHLYNQGDIEPKVLAQIGQYAENIYFGKPCGLMDQTTSALGGLVTIDFKEPGRALVRQVEVDFGASGMALVIVEPWGDHANLTDDYAAITREMRAVAQVFGGKVLRDCTLEQVLENIPYLRTQVNDRAILRAVHFFRDDQRVVDQVAALEAGNFGRFLDLVNESGRSSWMLLQNCYSERRVEQQGIAVALTVSEALLKGRGAWRVHGGGFAGTIQAFVPGDLLAAYITRMEQVCGTGSCHQVMIRPVGACRVDLG